MVEGVRSERHSSIFCEVVATSTYKMRYIDNFNLFELTNYMTEKEFGLCVLNGKLEAFSLVKNPVIDLDAEGVCKAEVTCINNSDKSTSVPSSSSSSKAPSRKHPAISSSVGLSVNDVLNGKSDDIAVASSLPPYIQRRPRSNSSTGGLHSCRKHLRGRATSLGDLGEPSTRRLLFDLISTLDDFFPDYDFNTTKPEQFLIKDVNQLIQTVNGYLAELTEERPNFLEKLWRGIDEVINLRKCEAYSLVPDMTEDPFSDGTLWSFNYFLFNHDLKQLIYFTCVAKRYLQLCFIHCDF